MKTPTLHLDRSYILLYSTGSAHPEVWQNGRQAAPGDAHPPPPGPQEHRPGPQHLSHAAGLCVCAKTGSRPRFLRQDEHSCLPRGSPPLRHLERSLQYFDCNRSINNGTESEPFWALIPERFHFSDNSGKLIRKV